MQTGQFLRWGLSNVDLVADMGEAFLDLQKAKSFVDRNEIIKPVQDKVAVALDTMPAFAAATDDHLREKLTAALAARAAKNGVAALSVEGYLQVINQAWALLQVLLPLFTR